MNIILLDEVDSTQNYIKARPELPVGSAVLAARQTAGRGRLGRSFASAEGGMYLSAVLDAGCAAVLTPAAAVAGRRALSQIGVNCGIKWVNDLVVERGGSLRKLCGIIAELSGGRAILGVGVNIAQRTEDFPSELREICTSVALEGGRTVAPRELAEMFLAELETALRMDPDSLLREYASACVTVGREVTVKRTPDDPGRPARCLGLCPDFAAEVEYADGSREQLFSGEASVKLG